MALIVHKYGGTSMGSPERIRNVATRVAKWHKAGHQMVVVPSAMAGETNRLIALAKEIDAEPDGRELDMIAATGEQVSVGLLAMALKACGVPAVSYAGWQVPVRTDNAFGKARIMSIEAQRVLGNGNTSLNDAIGGLTTRIGSTARDASVSLQGQEAIDAGLVAEREGLSGVNLDEEAANLLRYQQAYQAAAKVMQIASEMFDALLAIGR